jgi:hypothetical protein
MVNFPSAETPDKPSPATTAKPLLLYNGQHVDFTKVETFDINLDKQKREKK